jgi:hypothetical protein
MDKKKVVLAIPIANHSLSYGVATLIAKCFSKGGDPNYPYSFGLLFVQGLRPIESARNMLAGKFLKDKDADILWFIDHDTMPTNNSLELLEAMETKNADIMVGPVPFLTGDPNGGPPVNYNVYLSDGEPYSFRPSLIPVHGEVVNIDGAGTACMLIKREVLENSKLHVGDKEELDGDSVPIFKVQRTSCGTNKVGVDLDFSYRAMEAGYHMYAHGGVLWGHLKTDDVTRTIAISSELAQHMLDAEWKGK